MSDQSLIIWKKKNYYSDIYGSIEINEYKDELYKPKKNENALIEFSIQITVSKIICKPKEQKLVMAKKF